MHYSFPGQFRHIAKRLAQDPENEVVFICYDPTPSRQIEGVRKVSYDIPSEDEHAPRNNYVDNLAQASAHGKAVYQLCLQLKEQGFTPDIVCAHSAWGQPLFVKDAFPNVPYIAYMEFYFHAYGGDIHFYPDEPTSIDRVLQARARNANHLLNLEACDWAITPTEWQKHLMPRDFDHKISVIHEGVKLHKVKPFPIAKPYTVKGKTLPKDAEIMTYISRNFEPYRGFYKVMQAVQILLKQRPNLQVIMVGGDKVSYSTALPDGMTYREEVLKQLNIDESRIHWMGQLSYKAYLSVLDISDVHFYMTVPYVASWSLVEAMAMTCPIVASDTGPVKEFITDDQQGKRVDFFDTQQQVEAITWMLDHPEKAKKLGEQARKKVEEEYDLNKILPIYMDLIEKVRHIKGKN